MEKLLKSEVDLSETTNSLSVPQCIQMQGILTKPMMDL